MELEVFAKLFGDFTINFNLLWIALGCGIVLDFATGILKAYKKDGKICSSKLRDGGFKKCGIVLVAVISLGMSGVFNDRYYIITNSVLCYYIYTELISILENLDEMDVPIPPIFKKLLGHKEN